MNNEDLKKQIGTHIETINRELDQLTKLLEKNKKELGFRYTIDIKYSNVFDFWKCNLVLEQTSKIKF